VHQLVTALQARHPHKRFYLSGFSLGGNVTLKFLGELGTEAESRGIYGAAVTCVPFDLTQSQKKLDVGFNRAVYSMVRVYSTQFCHNAFLCHLFVYKTHTVF